MPCATTSKIFSSQNSPCCRVIARSLHKGSTYCNKNQTFAKRALASSSVPQNLRSMSQGAAVQSSAAAETTAGPLLQYVVLRKDLWKELKWPLGSIVAQGCHAATAALWNSRDDPTTQAYCAPENIDHMHKVVLEATGEAQLRDLAGKMDAAGIRHKLWVEQPENFVTCLATAPYPKDSVAPLVKKLKLCKGV